MTRVYLINIHWADADDQDLSSEAAAALGLPDEDFVDLDEHDGDWSENGLEDQCYDALERKHLSSGMKPSLFWIDEMKRL